jgi:RNA:NAD 2'-phosphotransferase (TPT1/KptA family)
LAGVGEKEFLGQILFFLLSHQPEAVVVVLQHQGFSKPVGQVGEHILNREAHQQRVLLETLQ